MPAALSAKKKNNAKNSLLSEYVRLWRFKDKTSVNGLCELFLSNNKKFLRLNPTFLFQIISVLTLTSSLTVYVVWKLQYKLSQGNWVSK